jgi:hypothetical protein
VPTFDEESLAIDLARCCLARWKKCVAAANQVGLLAEDLPDVVGTAIVTVGTVIAETDEAPVIIAETMIGLVTAVMDQARAGTLAADQAAAPRSLPQG